MSAFICTRPHVAAVAKYASAAGLVIDGADTATTLLRENIRSVNYRYDEHGRTRKFTAAEIDRAPVLSADALLKQVHCLRYQSCERPDFNSSRACKLLQSIEAHAIAAGAARGTRDYEAAPWGL